jgi:hypothetical protein
MLLHGASVCRYLVLIRMNGRACVGPGCLKNLLKKQANKGANNQFANFRSGVWWRSLTPTRLKPAAIPQEGGLIRSQAVYSPLDR